MNAGARDRDLLLIAAREPVPGETKTRLGKAVGMGRAAALYRAFLADLAGSFTPAAGEDRGYDLGWAFTPPGCDFRAVLAGLGHPPTEAVRFVPQVGGGWAERQANLLRWGHDRGYARTALLASDSPHLAPGVAADAFAALVGHDVVVGRVYDGGYYLVGLRGAHDVLSGVPMSSAQAADALVARARALGLRVAELAPTFDVDEAADLDLLRAALAPSGAAAPATWVALTELGLAGHPRGG